MASSAPISRAEFTRASGCASIFTSIPDSDFAVRSDPLRQSFDACDLWQRRWALSALGWLTLETNRDHSDLFGAHRNGWMDGRGATRWHDARYHRGPQKDGRRRRK